MRIYLISPTDLGPRLAGRALAVSAHTLGVLPKGGRSTLVPRGRWKLSEALVWSSLDSGGTGRYLAGGGAGWIWRK